MSAPSVAITRLDLSLSYGEFNLAASRSGFIGLSVLPAVAVDVEAADFAKISVEELLREVEDTKRKPKATYKRDDFTWLTDSYNAEEHGVEEIVDDATIEKYGDVIRAETIHTQRAIHRVLGALENDIASAVFNTTTWTGAALTTAVSTPWTTHATATPTDDIWAAIEKVNTSLGMPPNTLILSDFALRNAKQTADWLDTIKYSGRDDPKNVATIDGIRQYFDLENVFVARSFKNTAQEGQSAAFGRYWDKTMAMVCRVNDDGLEGDLESPDPSIGRTIFKLDGGMLPGMDDGEPSLIVEEYREENRRGGVIRARNKRHAKIIHAEAGHLLTAVTA